MRDGNFLPFPQHPHAEVMRSYDNKSDGFLIKWRMLVKSGVLKIKPEIPAEIDATYKSRKIKFWAYFGASKNI